MVLVDLLATHVVQSFSRSGSIAEVSRFDSRAGSTASGSEVLKVRAASVSASFVFCADSGSFVVLSLSLRRVYKYFDGVVFSSMYVDAVN